MLFPAYVHKDLDSAYGLTFPDLPGCFAAADELDGIPGAAQEAVEVYFEGEALPVLQASAPENWSGDERFRDGYWLLVDIDTRRLSSEPMRVNVSLPKYLVVQIDEYAKAHRMTRSGFLATAAEKAMHEEE
jgi:predicted RNase H-like HicB family nuclease